MNIHVCILYLVGFNPGCEHNGKEKSTVVALQTGGEILHMVLRPSLDNPPTVMEEFILAPNPDAEGLSVPVSGMDHDGRRLEISVVTERPLTLYLNGQEIVTLMTIGDYPELLAAGYPLNQNMLLADDEITANEHEEDIETIVVRTRHKTDNEQKLK